MIIGTINNATALLLSIAKRLYQESAIDCKITHVKTNMNRFKSLTIFFPFFNDAGTVERQIKYAYELGGKITDDLEVIAIHGGPSSDNTFEEIIRQRKAHPNLVILDKTNNTEGYAVIKYGFREATKEWVFYTDGDAQYHIEEDLFRLVEKQQKTGADIVNGYKKSRGDNFFRIFFGGIYAKISTFLFELPIRDTDCDFRLIRNSCLRKINLESTDASVLAELVKKLELVGAKFAEVPVSHFNRIYGTSNYTILDLFKEKLVGDLTLYFKIRKMRGGESKMRIFRFSFVGILSVAVQFILFNLFIIKTKTSPAASTLLADQIAIIFSFFLNNYITFRYNKFVNLNTYMTGFIKYYLIVMVSTIIQTIIVFIGNVFFGQHILVSNVLFIVGLIVGMFWNYLMHSRITWKNRT